MSDSCSASNSYAASSFINSCILRDKQGKDNEVSNVIGFNYFPNRDECGQILIGLWNILYSFVIGHSKKALSMSGIF